jgi:hypothetical protein
MSHLCSSYVVVEILVGDWCDSLRMVVWLGEELSGGGGGI